MYLLGNNGLAEQSRHRVAIVDVLFNVDILIGCGKTSHDDEKMVGGGSLGHDGRGTYRIFFGKLWEMAIGQPLCTWQMLAAFQDCLASRGGHR
jgi:hypothetical protein